jgi:hypothetical protein
MAVSKSKSKNPMLTKNGKQRLGPLNLEQLTKLLESARKKHIPKITRAIVSRKKTQQVSKKSVDVVEEAVTE